MTDLVQCGEEIIPTYERVLVKIAIVSDRTEGGIILPQEHVDKVQRNEVRATIVSVGPLAFEDLDEQDRPKIGDNVLIPKHGGQALTVDGKVDYETRIIRAEEVIAILRKKQ